MNQAITRNPGLGSLFGHFRIQRGIAFGTLIIAALLAFEIFNYSTTDFALGDLLGGLDFLGIKWATILAIAFCGIDFAGIARLFTPQEGQSEPGEVWYLFGAWMLAATMNALLTWWGVSIALLNHESLGNPVVPRETLLKVVPVFVAVMVWLIRVLIIGTFSVAGDKLFSQSSVRQPVSRQLFSPRQAAPKSSPPAQRNTPQPVVSFSPAPKLNGSHESGYSHQEPTYHPMGIQARSAGNNPSTRR